MKNQEHEPVRFRVVLELSLPQASDTDPSGYPALLDKLTGTIASMADPICRDVLLREALCISATVDDYSDWRFHRGEYDSTKWDPSSIGHVKGINSE